MEKLWQFLMRANARALFIGSLVALVVMAGWRGWVEFAGAATELPEDHATGRAEFKQGQPLGLLEFTAIQLAWDGAMPPCRFLPTLEALAADPEAAGAILERSGNKQWRGFQSQRTEDGKDPFGHLRGGRNLPVEAGGDQVAQGMARLTYRGFFKGPDGTPSAVFHDSSLNAGVFMRPGGSLHGMTLLDADINSAKIDLNDEELTLERNDHVEVKLEAKKP